MASDISLVLRSEHRQILMLADRCGREGRGFRDPVGDLRRGLLAHLSAAAAAVYPAVPVAGNAPVAERTTALAELRRQVADPSTTADELVAAAHWVVGSEQSQVLPALETGLSLPERRRIGKVFRIRRDAAIRSVGTGPRNRRSQTELYELARRAGVEQRSRMTQAQLQEAVAAWEHEHGLGG